MGLREDVHLKGQQFNNLGMLLFVGFIVVEVPTQLLAQRISRLGLYLGVNTVLWGITAACHAACTTYAALAVMRTLLGAFESCIGPIAVLIVAMWYKKSEQGRRISWFYAMLTFGLLPGVRKLFLYTSCDTSIRLSCCYSKMPPEDHLSDLVHSPRCGIFRLTNEAELDRIRCQFHQVKNCRVEDLVLVRRAFDGLCGRAHLYSAARFSCPSKTVLGSGENSRLAEKTGRPDGHSELQDKKRTDF